MNAVELKHICSGSLSHLSRSLYAFFIRPRLERGIKEISINELCIYLENSSPFFPTSGDPRLAVMALLELEREGFIRRKDQNASFEGCALSFPFFDGSLKDLPSRPFKMHNDWTPGPSFTQNCLICGLENTDYSSTELRSFRAYWNARPEERSQTAWERAFAQRLQRSRQAKARGGSNIKAATAQTGPVPIAPSMGNSYRAQKM